ncbi:apolipoprotein D-like [Penaeus japonicus]|uniref:apolipoprotein D-like n=1 Tax=Penaeus japonicus TaxID=27405 RepID=UPI001C70D941|nr:apolipoprotein D-like [Penaeus japonicus]
MKMQSSVVLLVLVAAASVECHKFRFGNCKNYAPVSNFEPGRMNGTWYVIRKVATTSTCMSVIYNNTQDYLEMREIRTPTSVTPFNIILTNIGKLTTKGNNPAVMNLKWENVVSNVLKTTYTVVDTDYDNYAIDAECQSLFFARRESATILSRTPTMSDAQIEELLQKLVAQGFDRSSLSAVDQSNCFEPQQVDYNIVVDEDGVRAGLRDEDDVSIVDITNEQELAEYINKTENEVQQQNGN